VGLDEAVSEEGVEEQVKAKRRSRNGFEAQVNQGPVI
jgi:hypothetical protein